MRNIIMALHSIRAHDTSVDKSHFSSKFFTNFLLCKNYKIAIIAFFILPSAIGSAQVNKKHHPDGTIEFHNRQHRHEKQAGPVNLESPYSRRIEELSAREGLDPRLVKCIIKVESNFKPDAISVAGAMGLMQIMQDIARYNVKDPLDPEENLNAGIRHFKSLMKTFKDDIPLALAAYHAGAGRVRKRMQVPPIKSTIAYVKRIMNYYNGTGDASIERKVRGLYQRIAKDGTIVIYN